MIKLENVTVKYRDNIILNNVNYEFCENKIYCIMGKSGCGKTTLLHTLAQIIKPDYGKVIYTEKVKKSVLFQEDRLLPNLTCEDNIKFVNKKCNVGKSLNDVELTDCQNMKPDELSGGMKRRLAIARMFAYGGDCFFIDEPTNGLDKITSEKILKYIKKELTDKTAFIITHSDEEARFFGNNLLIVDNGSIIEN